MKGVSNMDYKKEIIKLLEQIDDIQFLEYFYHYIKLKLNIENT